MKRLIGLVIAIGFLAGCAHFGPRDRFDRLGRVWNVSDHGWSGVWTRRANTGIFDAVWRDARGTQVQDEVTVESITGAQIVLLRKGLNGRYRGTLSNDHQRIENGTADWVQGSWTATITR